ncbi:MAG TPA: pseudouridine-5'-phosphate glycosidase [Acidimicrobiia bacterium]|nr:pseudouridine-5'-phosphate glycosidase [Acidimicrobiia bacterium]
MTDRHGHFTVSEEVRTALAENRPVVALESTIITHGMPHPRNLDTALDVEGDVRRGGAVPATIAVLDGKLAVGVGAAGIERLASHPAMKVSRRDLPIAIHTGALGGTTVATTMLAASMAGISLFATGGIGGVHRGGADSLDVSADLQELARTDVAVVCAGVKAILDIGLTLEYLETHGVTVLGYQTDEMPGFYATRSGHPIPHRLDSAADIAEVLRIRRSLALTGGTVVANPIPSEHAIDPAVIEVAIERALVEARDEGVSGKEATPFLLGRVVELTGSDSLAANVALVRSNARLAARIAVALT